MAQAKRDQNYVPTLLAVSSVDGETPVTLYADPTTHRLYVDTGGGGGGTWGSITGTLSDQTDLQTALNTKQDDISLTTSGTSGAATFIGNTLNIPQYSGTIDGSGTTDELTYWVDTDTVGALAVTTYPSLTELSYVKGTTSNIQTQLGNKQPLDTQLTAIAALADAAGALTNDGAGNFSYAAAGGTPGGSDTQFQYNNGGAFGGVANLTFNDSTGAVTLAGSTDTTQLIVKANATQSIANPLMVFQDSAGSELARINFPAGENIAIGYQAGKARTTGVNNIYMGYESGLVSSSANANIGIGYQTLKAATTGGSGNNIAIGAYAGAKINGSSECVMIGSASMYNTVGGADYSTFVGSSSGQGGVITAAGNTGIGYEAGYNLTSGANNVLLGRGSHGVTTGSTNIVIGYNNNPVSNTASDQLQIGVGLMGANINTLSTSVYGLGVAPSTSTTLLLRASTTAISSLRITSGTAPTSPVAGDFWSDGTNLLYRSTTSQTLATDTNTLTVTNKRNQPRVVSAASYTTDTGSSLDVSTADLFVITAQAGALLFNAPGGTPVQGERLVIRIKDNGTARALTWNAVFRAMGTALPTTTVLSKTLYLGFYYNSTDTKWDLVASAQEA